MPTTVVKSIGTNSRDYSTLQAWEDAKPANLVTADQVWKGEVYNDSEFAGKLVISGSTTSATCYVWLTAAAGHGIADHANRLTNQLKYDQTKGAGINFNSAYEAILDVRDNYTKIERLQFKSTGVFTNYNAAVVIGVTDGSNITINNCLFEYTGALHGIRCHGNNHTIANSLIIMSGATFNAGSHAVIIVYATGGAFVNNTIVRPSDRSANGNGITRSGGSTNILVQNNAVFGFTTAFNGWGSGTAAGTGYNACNDASAPGTNNQQSLTYTSQFEGTTSGAMDFRAKSGSALASNATRNATYTSDVDIVATARSTSTPSIGAWEFGGTLPLYLRVSSNFPANTTRKLTVWSDTSYGTVLYNLQNVTCNASGLFELSATGVTAGTYYPAQLTAHGANQTVQIQGTGSCWALAGT